MWSRSPPWLRHPEERAGGARLDGSYVVGDRHLAERRRRGKLVAGHLHISALALEIIGDGAAQGRIGDVVRRMGGHRHIAARELVLALRARFYALEPARYRELDRLVIAQLEVQERVVLDRAPMAAGDSARA